MKCPSPSRRTIPLSPAATAVSAVPLPTTYLARSLYAEPFLAGFNCDEGHRAGLPRPQPWSVSYNLAAAKPHMECGNLLPLSPVPLPFRQCLFLRRTLLVPFILNHSSQASIVTKATVRACPVRSRGRSATTLPRRSRLWSAGTCYRFLAYSRMQTPPFSPSDLSTPISDTSCPRARNRNRLCISLCSLCFLLFIPFFVFVLASIVTQFRRGEPRNTRNTRKVGKDDDPGLPVGRLRFPPVVLAPPARFRGRRSAPYGHPAPWQRHIPRAFPRCFAAAGGERTHSLAFRASARSRVPPTSTQREQVDPAFRSWLSRGEAAYGVRELVTAFWPTAAPKHPSSRVPISQLRSPTPCVLVLEIVIVFVFPSVPSASSCSFPSSSSCWRQS